MGLFELNIVSFHEVLYCVFTCTGVSWNVVWANTPWDFCFWRNLDFCVVISFNSVTRMPILIKELSLWATDLPNSKETGDGWWSEETEAGKVKAAKLQAKKNRKRERAALWHLQNLHHVCRDASARVRKYLHSPRCLPGFQVPSRVPGDSPETRVPSRDTGALQE